MIISIIHDTDDKIKAVGRKSVEKRRKAVSFTKMSCKILKLFTNYKKFVL